MFSENKHDDDDDDDDEDKIMIKNPWECKRFIARRLLKKFPNKANILNMSYKNTAHLSHTQTHSSVE